MALDHTALATAALWVAVTTIHVLSCAFYGLVAYVYRMIPDTQLSADMKAFQLTSNMKYFPVVVIFHVVCSAAHLVCFFEMSVQSIRCRKWYFHRTKVSKRTTPAGGSANQDLVATKVSNDRSSRAGSMRRLSLLNNSITRTTSSAWQHTFGYTGFFGIHDEHFTLVFLVREVAETILQSLQAWNLSCYVLRIWLNRFAVAVVVLGCWSTPMI